MLLSTAPWDLIQMDESPDCINALILSQSTGWPLINDEGGSAGRESSPAAAWLMTDYRPRLPLPHQWLIGLMCPNCLA